MPFFHATTADRLASIARTGLGGVDTGPRTEGCARGVYLASDPRLAVAVMLMHALNGDGPETAPSPAAYLASVRILVVDDARIDRAQLTADPQVTGWTGSWVYDGVIDTSGAPVLTVADVSAGFAGEDGAAWGWRTIGVASGGGRPGARPSPSPNGE